MTNAALADTFDLVADILEFQAANPFRVRAYRNGARTIRDHADSIASLAAEGKDRLKQIDGIGDDLALKIVTLVQSGELPKLKELQAQVPESVLALMKIPGVGPKKAAALHKELGIQTLEQLKAACEAGQVRSIKGFGEKTEKLIQQGICVAATANERMYWAEADNIVQELRTHLQTCPGIEQLEFAGSYRRGRDTVGDLDCLVVSRDFDGVMDRLESFPERAETLARGDTKMSIRLRQGLQVDLRVVPAESFGAALQYFTGSKDHNVILRGKAKDRGLKINEYGVYRVSEGEETRIAGATEAEVYAALDLPVFPPELREARREYEWAARGELPELVTVEDIVGDLHMHTLATDGTHTILEMVAAARECGLSYIAITDHSKRVSMANGLDAKRVLAQWQEIDNLNRQLAGEFTILKGIECDILEKGGMDLPDDVLAQADWVMASIHYGQKQSRQQITERMLGAIENPHVSAISHPTGRILNRRPPYEVDLDAMFKAAKAHGKFMELNANPARLDLNDVQCAAAKANGILIVISTDAHSTEGLNCMRYGILQARRAGLTKADVVNARSWPELRKLMEKR